MSVSGSLRRRVSERDRGKCAYCRSSEFNSGQALHIDHIVPQAAGGSTSLDNLCQVCFSCNIHKGAKQSATDPVTEAEAALFHPLRQRWQDHFIWDVNGTVIVGTTPCGRATVQALQMNNPIVVQARRRWVSGGWHPPAD